MHETPNAGLQLITLALIRFDIIKGLVINNQNDNLITTDWQGTKTSS